MARELVCVAPVGDRCGEGAVWSAEEAALYWTDINRFLIHRYDEATCAVRTWLFDEPVVAISLTREDGRLLIALGSKLIWWWPETDRRQDHGFVLPGSPRVRLNDGRADPLGNFWVGSMKNNVLPDGQLGDVAPGEGILYRIAPDGTVTEWRHGLGISNTLCWSPDRSTFYFGDTLANEIYAFDYHAVDGSISGERPFFTGFDLGAPDGSAIDSEGFLWNCRYGGGCIARVAPDGSLAETIDMPITNITTCTFGGADLKTLYITTAGAGPAERLAGSLYAMRVTVAGMPENRFGAATK
ncbi:MULTISPECIES: SMP-30/gluconolactonase/LRE family protein [Ensifer]|uniref:SMP-30/gluconolactonase/LRE family protein n=1 Tax=Ensifer adhaerens TaxID=106592 RepID=A0ABY8HMY9_ENSAD|nr:MULTISPECIES: SMP-30/gluconolactonase/LRE family protein [Ensifer]ANK76284.1 gluconolaconase [Ensifer adhaerens]KDP76595.1 gluconolaconase [Ensifer adhaerens]KQX31870.1 gluconolaconase [Ensifer sp. Root423]KQZ54001.1 gluconolaconase [Ensifer sp. Root558]MBD9520458.1 SMP-30/gluconolactonase/LRE family protein [Ensifer sp. ENS02]